MPGMVFATTQSCILEDTIFRMDLDDVLSSALKNTVSL